MIALALLLQTAEITVLTREKERVLVGRSDGSVEGYGAEGLKLGYRIPSGAGSVRALTWIEGHAWWVGANGDAVWHVDGRDRAVAVPLASVGLSDPAIAVSEWRKTLLVQSESGYAFLDRKSGARVPDPLPPAVAEAASQGQILASWDERIGGMFLVLRRAGRKGRPDEEGGTRDVTAVSGWHLTPKGRWQGLGHYFLAAGDYRDAPGPSTRIVISKTRTDTAPRGVIDLRHFLVTPNGIVALLKRKVVLIPFATDDWQPREFRSLPFDPEYTPVSTLIGSRLMYSNGRRIGELDLEDGERSIQTSPPRPGLTAMLATDGGLVTGEGASLALSDDFVAPGRLRYDVEGDRSRMNTEQRALLARLDDDAFSAALPRGGTQAFQVLAEGAFGKKAETRIRGASRTRDLEFGDVLRQGDRRAVYLGGGDAIELSARGTAFRRISDIPDWLAYRVARPDPRPVFRPRPTYRPDPSRSLPPPRPMEPVNLFDIDFQRVRKLGGGGSLRLATDPRYNRPWRPAHGRMIQAAESWLNTPYVYGGKSRRSIDCSGFVSRVMRELGLRVPDGSTNIARCGLGTVVTDEIRYGDVLYIERPNRHVGIYVGKGRTIEATPTYTRYMDRSCLLRYPVMVRRFL